VIRGQRSQLTRDCCAERGRRRMDGDGGWMGPDGPGGRRARRAAGTRSKEASTRTTSLQLTHAITAGGRRATAGTLQEKKIS
jgi:hypothetical protein